MGSRKDAKYHGSCPCVTGLIEELSQHGWESKEGELAGVTGQGAGSTSRAEAILSIQKAQEQHCSAETDAQSLTNTSGTIKAALNPRRYYPSWACKAFESQKLLEKSQYNLWQTITPIFKKLFFRTFMWPRWVLVAAHGIFDLYCRYGTQDL